MRFPKAFRGLFSWVTVASMLPIVVAVLASGYITYRYNRVVTETREMVEHSLRVTTAIDDLMIDLQDLETGQRGYLITGEDTYLEPFETARGRFEADLGALDNLIADNPAQTATAGRIATLARAKLDELDETIRVRRDEGFAAARTIVADDSGKALMDRIRDAVATMRGHEQDLLTANTDRMRRTEKRVVVVVAIGIGLSLLGRLAATLIPIFWRARLGDSRETDAE
ncbi:MAG: CHASE3 domain-containing protein [Bauldia sp.]|uniref:CHASE3 domain-containing protein n=1 Tax=Bauldia sp. TaxID=2575872 RepID=UPI001D74A561|nr:CHASE3 domain-containing protein [Bauldia sp.]MCB1494614.1 CHASE3 domain-containing protein [Bauldia sp.]